MIRKLRAPKPAVPSVKPVSKGFGVPSAKATLGNVAGGRAPRQVINPIKTDRGAFGIKS